jgi:hypothetical protein
MKLGALTSRKREGKIGQKPIPTSFLVCRVPCGFFLYLTYFMLNVDGSGHANKV